jgi:hypothetical protein
MDTVRCRRRWCALAMMLAASAAARPQPGATGDGVQRPEAARRIVGQFGFEPGPREVFELPRYWSLAQTGSRLAGHRPGFPAWNSAAFDDTHAFAGVRSVKLTTRGGSTSLRLEPGVIPVFPGTDYLVSARVRTSALNQARAAIRARYLDSANTPIAASESSSRLVRTQGDEWTLLTVAMSGEFPQAAYIQVDLELLQPDQFQDPGPDKHRVLVQDIAGAAWFDQVAIVQLPRASISTPSPINVFRGEDRPRVSVFLRDLTGEQLTGRFTLQDAAGHTVDTQLKDLPAGSGTWDWSPRIDRFGWYRASLELRTADRRVGATYLDFAWLPPPRQPADADGPRFALILDDLPAADRPSLAAMVSAAGAGAVTVPAWMQATTPETVAALCRDLPTLVEQLRAARIGLTLSLPTVPAGLASDFRIAHDQVLAVLERDEKQWGPYLTPLLDRFGQGVQRWQIGSAKSPPTDQSVTPSQLSRAHGILAKLVPGPIVEIPWPADREPAFPPPEGSHILAILPPGSESADLADLGRAWSRTAGDRTTVVLSPLSQAGHSRLDSCVALVKQSTLLWSSPGPGQPPPTLALVQPWSWPGDARARGPMPHAELAAWSNLSDRLRARRPAGPPLSASGVTCLIFSPADAAQEGPSGMLAVWAESPAAAGTTLDLYLGDRPVDLVDLFGNRTPLAPVPAGAGTGPRAPLLHRIPVADEPIFVEGVDVDLAVFAASFRLDPPFAASSTDEHEVAMVLSNPWRGRIEGRITVLEPGGLSSDAGGRDRSWRITPRTSTFSIGPSETGRIPLLIAFSAVEEAGPREFLVEIELAGTRDYPPVRLRSTLEIGVHDFHMDLSYRLVNTGDLVVEAQVINRTPSPAAYELSAFAEAYPRGKAFISDLPPSALATRRFLFPGGAAKLKGQRIVVSTQDAATQSRVTRSILIE